MEKDQIEVKISKTEFSSFGESDDDCAEDGILIYTSIINLYNKPVDVELSDAYILNTHGLQRSRDAFYTGYGFCEQTIQANAKKIMGEVYLFKSVGNVEEGWIYGIRVKDKTNKTAYDIQFQLVVASDSEQGKMYRWKKIRSNVISDKMLIEALKNKIDRIENLEDRFGIKIENISIVADFDEDEMNYVSILFELFGTDDDKFPMDLYLMVVIYNKDGSIIGSKNSYIRKTEFVGYQLFDMRIYALDGKRVDDIGRIRIYPATRVNS